MYGGQGNYAPQFRQGPPHPSYQQAPPGPPPPFRQAPPGPPPLAVHQGPPVHSIGQQAPPSYGRMVAPPAQQPVHFPHHAPVNPVQPYLHRPPAPHQANGSAPAVPPYPLPGHPLPVPMPNTNAHHAMQPMPPPSGMLRPAPPQPNSQTQGQVMYHSRHLPHPGIHHAPTHPPWPPNAPNPLPLPPPTFEFTAQNHAVDAHTPPPPTPPPPPPPQSPPPLPPLPPAPVPAAEEPSFDSLKVISADSKVDSKAHELDYVPAHVSDGSKTSIEGNKAPLVEREASDNFALPPLRPDETVVRTIEALCQFIVKVGPDFENTARAKEAGNPQFAFLFGGKPGSAAAIGYEYFQWMKKKYVAELESFKGPDHNVLSTSTLMADVSSQSGNLEQVDLAHSPATSDMDMEDDITPAGMDKDFSSMNKESTVSVNMPSHAPRNVKEELHAGILMASEASCPIVSVMDAEDEKESSFFEDVSPERVSPDAARLGDRIHASSIHPMGDSNKDNASTSNEDAKSQEALGVYLKYGSPFRLIQDYASDESDEDAERGDDEDSNPVSPSPATIPGPSSLQQDELSELYSNFGGQNSSAVGNGSKIDTASGQLSPSKPKGTGGSPHKGVSPTRFDHFDTMKKNVDPDIHLQDNISKDERETSGPSSEFDDLEGRKMDANQETGKFNLEQSVMEKHTPHEVDEFGRWVRKGVSSSDSEDNQSSVKNARGGRSQSGSWSRSPQRSRRRHRSRSPRRRDKRSHSHSWSPKRGRSKSPLSFRTNLSARRGRDLPPECFNFIRGRCFYGASCRFLHRDFGHVNVQQRYQDPRKPHRHDIFDDASFSRINRHDKAFTAEWDAEKGNKLAEARAYEKHLCKGKSDMRSRTLFSRYSDGKDEPATEAEDYRNQVSQEMISQGLESRVGKVPIEQNLAAVEEESSRPLLELSEPLQPDSLPVKSPAHKSNSSPHHVLLEQSSSGDPISSQPSQTTSTNALEAQNSSQLANVQELPISHQLPGQTSHSSTLSIRPSTSQIHGGLNIAVEATANQSVSSPSRSYNVTSIKPSGQPLHEEFSPHLLTSDVNFQSLQPLPTAAIGQRPMHFHHDGLAAPFASQHFRENVMPPITSYQSQLPPSNIHYPHQSPFPNILQSNNAPHPNCALSALHPLQPSQMSTLPNRPLFHSSELSQLHQQQNVVPLRNDFKPSIGTFLPGDIPSSRPSGFYSESFFSLELSGHPQRQTDDSKWRPLPMGNQQDQPFGKDGFSLPTMPEGPRCIFECQTDQVNHQAFTREGGVPVQSQGFTANSSVPLPRSFQGGYVEPRPYPSEEFSVPHTRNLHHSQQQPLYSQQTPASGNLLPSFGTPGPMHPSSQRYTDNNFQPHSSDIGLPRFPFREYYNPYASTFEQPLRGPSIPNPEIRRYDSSLGADNTPIVATGSWMRTSPRNSRTFAEQVLPITGRYTHESSAEVMPDAQKQLLREPVAGTAYDPLFDSIEPSSDTSKMRVEEQSSGVNDTGSASKFNLHRPSKVGVKRHKGGSVAELKAEVDELGEVATDADAGGVENASPQLLDDRDWSPEIPADVGETNVGEIEIDQVRSPGKSKKNRDSRSMKLFKIALADFAKEVLKPSWRQGNMSKEAFKTIVKKTVDKVAGAVPSHQIPKSQAKINQYVESSQRKLTKLVMGYVDKYVKM